MRLAVPTLAPSLVPNRQPLVKVSVSPAISVVIYCFVFYNSYFCKEKGIVSLT